LEPEDAELFSKYAEKLAEQGLFVTAAKYSRYVPCFFLYLPFTVILFSIKTDAFEIFHKRRVQ
jgi:hypothetical protein